MSLEIHSLKEKNDDLVLMARDACVLVAPHGTTIPASILNGSGDLIPFTAAWRSMGELDLSGGITITPDMTTADVEGYGSTMPRRTVVTKESVTFGLTAQETKALNLELYWGEDFSQGVVNDEQLVKKSTKNSKIAYWSIFIIAQDSTADGIALPYWVFPKATVTKKDSIKFGVEEALAYPLEFSVFEDEDYDGFVGIGNAGEWITANATAGGFDAS